MFIYNPPSQSASIENTFLSKSVVGEEEQPMLHVFGGDSKSLMGIQAEKVKSVSP